MNTKQAKGYDGTAEDIAFAMQDGATVGKDLFKGSLLLKRKSLLNFTI